MVPSACGDLQDTVESPGALGCPLPAACTAPSAPHPPHTHLPLPVRHPLAHRESNTAPSAALRAGPPACLPALRTRVLARGHGVLAQTRPGLPARAIRFPAAPFTAESDTISRHCPTSFSSC